jgi:rRNA maturation endonuclease Nob1
MLLAAAILLIAVTVVFTFSVRDKDMPAPEPVSPTRHLDERRAAIYENLRDLQFEYRVGKLSDADYQQTKVGLQKELAGVLAEIEKVNSVAPAIQGKAAAAAQGKAAAKVAPGTVCPHCNATFAKPMKFCGECGKAMS